MEDEYLATGFTDVDRATDAEFYAQCLSMLDALPYYQQVKRRSYELLKLGPGVTVLDAGCGLGDDAFRMAEKVLPDGRIVGLDASGELIAKARADPRGGRLPAKFHQGDVKAMPFDDGSFTRCRVDRVLQHIPQPQAAISELARVLEPGGLLLAYDNDWSTFSVDSPVKDRETTDTLATLWSDSFVNSRIGRQLESMFREVKLADIQVIPSTSIIYDFETADRIYNLRTTMRKAVNSGKISETIGTDYIHDLLSRSAEGTFKIVLTAYTVVGRR